MLTFTLAISCLTTSILPWFMDLTLQVPMQYCSLSPVTSTTGHCLHFGSVSSFFLELFLHWSSVAYWAPTDLGSSSFSVLSFCLFILFMGFSRQEYWVVCHSLLQWTTLCQTSPPWPMCLGWLHTAWLSFTELDKLWSVWSDWLVVCNCSCFFTCIQISQEAGNVVWYSQHYKNFPVLLWSTQSNTLAKSIKQK